MKTIYLSIFLLWTLTTTAQSIDVETVRIPTAKKLEIQSYNGCCAKKGYRAVYLFDNKGQAIESSNFFKRKLLAKNKYVYNDNGLLTEKIKLYSINDKKLTDTTKFKYKFDTQGRLIFKSEQFGQWISTETYYDFDSNGFPLTIAVSFDNKTTILKKEYDSLGREIRRQKVENDSIITLEESKYNQYGDLVYSILPTLKGVKTDGLDLFIGGSRLAAIEEYQYTYDNLDRWLEKYVIFDGKKVLLEKRIYN